MTDAQADLHINPLRFLIRILWAWNPAYPLGTHTGFNHVYNTPYTWSYVALSILHVPAFAAQLTVMFCIYLAVAWSMYVGLVMLAPRLPDDARLAGAAAFSCNIYVAFNSNGSTPMLLSYAAIPLFVGLTAAAARGSLQPVKSGLAIAIIVFIAGGFNPPLIAINIVCAVIAGLVFVTTHPERLAVSRRLAVFGAVAGTSTVLLNAYWIAPFLDYMRTTWLGGILDESPTMHNADTTFANVLRGLGQWGIFQSGPRGPWYAWAHWYVTGFFGTLLWVVPIIGTIGLLRRRLRFAAFAPLVIIIVSVPLVTGYYTGNFVARLTAVVYDWAYHFVPLFQMFRSVYKWVGPLEFGFGALYALAAAAALAVIRARSGKNAKVIRPIALTAFCAIPVLAYYPVVVSKANPHAEPLPAWVENESRFSMSGDGRVALLPGQYLEDFAWGNPTYYIENSTFSQPLLYGYLGGAPNEATDQWLRNAYRRFRSGDPDARALFEFLGARMLVDRRDLRQDGDFAFMGRAVHTDSSTSAVLLRRLGLKPRTTDGANVFYPLPGALPRVYTVSQARLFPGPTAAFANSPSAAGVLRGETFIMADDLIALNDQSALSSIVRPRSAFAGEDLRLSLASRGYRIEMQSENNVFQVPRTGRYELAVANAAELYPELPEVRTLQIDGLMYNPVFDRRGWVRLGRRTFSAGVHFLRASWLSPSSAIIFAYVPLPTNDSNAPRILSAIPQGRHIAGLASKASVEFAQLGQNPAWPDSPPMPLQLTRKAAPTPARFQWEHPEGVFQAFPISNRWATQTEFYRWNAMPARPAVIMTSRTRLSVVWYGKQSTRAVLRLRVASLGNGFTLKRPTTIRLPDWTGAEPGYPVAITLELHLRPGRNAIPLETGGRMLTTALELQTSSEPTNATGICTVVPDARGAVAELPKHAAECRIGLRTVGSLAPAEIPTAHLQGEIDSISGATVTLVSDIHLRSGRILHLEWPIDGAIDLPMYAALSPDDAEAAVNANYSLVLKRANGVPEGGAHIVAIVSSQETASGPRTRARDLSHVESAEYVRRSPVEIDVTLPPSSSGRWLVLDESFHPEWRARVNSRVLDHVAIDGFMNGWYVPASSSERHVVLTFDGQRIYRASAAVSILAALAMLAGLGFRKKGL